MKKKQHTLLNIFDNSSTQNHTIPLRLNFWFSLLLLDISAHPYPKKSLLNRQTESTRNHSRSSKFYPHSSLLSSSFSSALSSTIVSNAGALEGLNGKSRSDGATSIQGFIVYPSCFAIRTETNLDEFINMCNGDGFNLISLSPMFG